MWVEALELVLQDLRAAGVDLGRFAASVGRASSTGRCTFRNRSMRSATGPRQRRCTSKSGHCSRARLRPSGWTARPASNAPKSLAPWAATSAWPTMTGSRATLRFTGPQIRRFYKTCPDDWQRTAEIHLVSSFIPSLLVGKSVEHRSRRWRGHESSRPRQG